jgi:hypothetical protein
LARFGRYQARIGQQRSMPRVGWLDCGARYG